MKLFYKLCVVIIMHSISASAFAQTDSTTSFEVSGVCAMCKQRIEKAIKIKGVSKASWDIPSHILTLIYNPNVINLEKIQSKIADVGHDTPLKKADPDVYASLPDCCLYHDIIEEAHDIHNINGVILSEDRKGNFTPLEGASIIWLYSKKGTTSDSKGVFNIAPEDPDDKLVISYSGFSPDTLEIKNMNDVQVILGTNNVLQAVQVTASNKNTYINRFSAIRIQNVSSGELLKAACCNLSESFETNPSVDVAVNDAATGSRQIQLLGLSGNYTQLTVDNLPGPRGLATPLGLNSIAGPWVEGIQIIKGAGSVANGYESIAGQINVELVKPDAGDRIFANVYTNSVGKTDLNLNLAQKINNRWSTGLLLHDAFLNKKSDYNKDGFRDQPTGNLFSAVNRWMYHNSTGFSTQFGVKVLLDEKEGGMMNFNSSDKLSTSVYGLGINTERYEGFAKIGYVFSGNKYKSIGLALSGYQHDQKSFFGTNVYNANQKNFYGNLIYQSVIGNSDHKFRAGLSLNSDVYDEVYTNMEFARTETVAGSFFEYTWNASDKFSAVAGIRADHNNIYGWFATPRLHLKYNPLPKTTIRFTSGRGQRTSNILAENTGSLVSSRTISILGAVPGKAYGLDPEIAWNNGISVDQQFKLFGRTSTLSVDFYRNDFINQVIADIEDPRQLKFYNLDGKSYSNSFQAELNFYPAKNFDVRLAYRWFDVKTTYSGKLLEKPLTAANRAFVNLGYNVSGWKFDYTVNYVGEKRIPSTLDNPVKYRMAEKSPGYFTMNAQVSKTLNKKYGVDLYLGVENITGYMQDVSIIAADDPFSNYFDASLIWGPVSERMIYGGLRFKLK